MVRLRRRVAAAVAAAALATAVAAAPAAAYTETDILNMAGHGTISPSYLVVHSTANPGATAANHVAYWTRMGNGSTMAHWVIDWTNGGQVYQMAASDRLVYHVGYGNRYSVGIEICEGTTRAQFDEVFDEAAKWCADFLNSRGWGIDRMVIHSEARYIWGGTDHVDPVPYFSKWDESWSSFESRVSYYMRNGTGAPADTGRKPSTGGSSSNQGTGSNGHGTSLPGGTYTVNCSALNIRTGHTVNSSSTGTYRRGQTVNLDDEYYIQDGYVWGTYVAYSGNRRYVAVGKATGKVEPGDYLVRSGSSPYKTTAELASEVMRGVHGNGAQRRSSLGSRYQEVQDYVNAHYF